MTAYEGPTDLFINGAWRAGADGRRFPVLDPATGKLLASFAAAALEDCEAAVDAAGDAFPSWSATPPRERSELLRRVFELMTAEAETLAAIIVAENGKAWPDAIVEAKYSAEFFRWFAEEAVRIPGEYRGSPSGDKRIVVTHQSIGVSLLITPWNFPAAMAARKIAPALAAGCTVVLKPASETPLTAAFIVELLNRARVPAGVVNLVTPKPVGPAVESMLADARVRKLSFTGSTEVGRQLLASSARRVVSTSMELGGNAPLVVLPGADLDVAIAGTVDAKMRNGGSACTAANRIYVHASLHEEFLARLTDRFLAFTLGPGSTRSNTLGALVSQRERDKVAELVETAVGEGATIVLGGADESSGCFYPATILKGVAHGSTINSTEIFGPVAAIVRYDDVEDALLMANDSEFGLSAYVFGPEGDAVRFAFRLQSGMVGVNRGVISDPAAPFGGVKQSGLGREGGFEGILEFLETQYLSLPA
ncbi:NAD-dependent succinate-semialdehyde dehydrogenase [Leifsonia shinshuensis]|uniref:NAD-dependent succinate-semialdehyde dehydrogenase n=1 Tax=Leifsonia shinshuensis TaxID=150026 RepID=A0A7G6YA72_9MICO|nr:NAD-dependent succinate-semialdehyde dehydrogenase [Leifsonia shinshuensis]QNE35387.1 NAD-dependent succinate-semialdehyde dehydrogenase [Leifsonia shinshuensis]